MATKMVTLYTPDDVMDVIYDGPLSDVHNHIMPGAYPATRGVDESCTVAVMPTGATIEPDAFWH